MSQHLLHFTDQNAPNSEMVYLIFLKMTTFYNVLADNIATYSQTQSLIRAHGPCCKLYVADSHV